MAENKKSFVAYVDWKNVFDMLENEEAGKLIKHLLAYVNDENPEMDDRLIKMAFEPIKAQLKRDLQKYEKACERNRENIAKRWNKDKPEDTKNTTGKNGIPIDTKNTDNGTGNDNGNGNDNDIKNKMDNRKLKFANTLTPFNQIYPREMLKDFYEYWTEPNKSGTKFKQELEKTWSLERRLETWAKNDKTFSNGKSQQKNTGANADFETNR